MDQEEPLLSRVWCAQERVLANRTLHIASHQMYWECSADFKAEDDMAMDIETCSQYNLQRIASGLASVMQAPKLNTTDNNKKRWGLSHEWRPWLRLIEEYTSRNMTVTSDKLPALSGVMSALQTLTGDRCLAGIWESWFAKGLLWRIQDPERDSYVFHAKPASRPRFWRAPSWSFAALDGVVAYKLLEYDTDTLTCAALVQCHLVPKGKNPLGELAEGYATIRGPIAHLFNAAEHQSSDGRDCRLRLTRNRLAEARVFYDVEYYAACDVLLVTPHAGIAIVPDKRDSTRHVRVGAVTVYRILDPGMQDSQDLVSVLDLTPLSAFSAADWPEPVVLTLA